MAGLWGRAGSALAGPHPVALICFFFFFFLQQSFSLSAALTLVCLCCHTSNPAFLSLCNSIFSPCISLHPLSLHHRRGCMCALVMMVRGFKPASLFPSLLPLLHFRSTPPLPPLPAHICSNFFRYSPSSFQSLLPFFPPPSNHHSVLFTYIYKLLQFSPSINRSNKNLTSSFVYTVRHPGRSVYSTSVSLQFSKLSKPTASLTRHKLFDKYHNELEYVL